AARAVVAASGSAVPTEDRPTVIQTHCRLTSMTISSEPLVPTWDRDRQELRDSCIVVKRFKVPAAKQEIILAAFEEEHWPRRIDNPLPRRGVPSPGQRLQETIKSLNRHQKRPLIRFFGDGSGQGVRWEFCDEGDSTRDN